MAWSPEPFAFEAIGTQWVISLPDGLSVSDRENLERAIRERIAIYDRDYSRFRPDSLVAAMSQTAGTYELPEDAEPMLSLYEEIYGLSEGAVTPLIGQVLSDAGYDAGYSLEEKTLAAPPQWDEALDYDYPSLTVKQPVLFDFGAAGKGYLIDLIAGILRVADVEEFIIDAGGDILHNDPAHEFLEIALEHPDDAALAVGVARIANRSLCGSAGNRRTWGRFHHIIDPRTLESPRHIKAIWTVSRTTLIADMMTTALFFVRPEILQREYDFDYLIIRSDNSYERSDNFPAEIF